MYQQESINVLVAVASKDLPRGEYATMYRHVQTSIISHVVVVVDVDRIYVSHVLIGYSCGIMRAVAIAEILLYSEHNM